MLDSRDLRVIIWDIDENSQLLMLALLEKRLWINKKNVYIMDDWFDILEKIQKEIFDIIIIDTRLKRLDWVNLSKEINYNSSAKSATTIWYSTDEEPKDHGFDYYERKWYWIEWIKNTITMILNNMWYKNN
jgi:DNA-binding NtrC family response regulator